MRYLIIVLFLLNHLFAQSQKRPVKFGNVSKDELENNQCEFYPEAAAMIIANFANIRFLYSNDQGFRYQLDETTRKKIFKIAGKDEGNISLKIYDPVSGAGKENISSIKAFTYNLLDGKIIKTKLDNSNEFKTRLNDYWIEYSFAMPDIREGSVIEYSYTKTSDYISNLQPWYFQQDIPVGYSDLRVTIPEYFKYQVNQIGNYIPVKIEENNVQETFTTGSSSGTQSTQNRSITSASQFKSFIANNIVPLEEEPFMNNKVNLPSRIEFQLMQIIFPGSPIKNMASNYEKFTSTLRERASFGGAIKNGNFAKDKIKEMEGSDEMTMAKSLYSWIDDNMAWNDVYTYSSTDAGRKVFNEKKGSIADINLTLISALKAAGLEANPVLLSTRGHGIPHPVYPNFTDFNYVIAAIKIANEVYLCDATSNMPFGILPLRCLNGNGWMITEQNGSWVDLKSQAEHSSAIYADISIEEDQIVHKIKSENRKYAAININSSYKEKGHENFQDDLSKNFNDWRLNELNFTASTADTLDFSFEIVKDFNNEDIVYIQPVLFGAITENPFVRESRISSIDFPYKRKNIVISRIMIPEGYEAEIPDPAIIRLPDNSGSFIYSCSNIGDMVNILSNFTMTKQDFSPDEYPMLKQFYQLMSEKNNEVIILKKI